MYLNLNDALSKMILSVSGWRSIFAADGDEDSPCPNISQFHKIIAAAAAKVFSDFLGGTDGAVIVGMDTRPTGGEISDAVIRSLLANGRKVLFTGVVAAPEIMAFARLGTNPGQHHPEYPERDSGLGIAGFIYISASHNPIGHNGLKFGLTDGGVLKASDAEQLKEAFKSFMSSYNLMEQAHLLLMDQGEEYSAVYSGWEDNKKTALACYCELTVAIVSGFKERSKQREFFGILKKGLERKKLSVAADFNGSARTVSIDRSFFSSLGITFYCMNDIPGRIAHRIVPEGESLEPCRDFMELFHKKDPSLVLAYVPDCDGDRGNLVIWDERQQRARPLEAQEVFALACIAELSHLVWTGEIKSGEIKSGESKLDSATKVAVAVNDPTSLRIDRIAAAFGAAVFRAEVGEANVVSLARNLREQGYLVRILGEGSAGGTITHPSSVRDPLDTLSAILKLLTIHSGEGQRGLFEIWCLLSDQSGLYREDFTLADIIASLPAFVSTGAYSEKAQLKVKTLDHGILKNRYQEIFLREWKEKKDFLKERFGISGWEVIAYNGVNERRGIPKFGEAGSGGLKIEFSGPKDSNMEFPTEGKKAFIWMRGSGTESVFRVMADAESPELEKVLIEWQRKMVLEADNG